MSDRAEAGGAAPQPTVHTAPGVPQPSPSQLAEWARGDADLAAGVLEREKAGLEFARAQADALVANAEQAVEAAQALADEQNARAAAAEAAAGQGGGQG